MSDGDSLREMAARLGRDYDPEAVQVVQYDPTNPPPFVIVPVEGENDWAMVSTRIWRGVRLMVTPEWFPQVRAGLSYSSQQRSASGPFFLPTTGLLYPTSDRTRRHDVPSPLAALRRGWPA